MDRTWQEITNYCSWFIINPHGGVEYECARTIGIMVCVGCQRTFCYEHRAEHRKECMAVEEVRDGAEDTIDTLAPGITITHPHYGIDTAFINDFTVRAVPRTQGTDVGFRWAEREADPRWDLNE